MASEEAFRSGCVQDLPWGENCRQALSQALSVILHSARCQELLMGQALCPTQRRTTGGDFKSQACH